MRILLVAATQMEIMSFINDGKAETLVTGVGIPSTVFHLTKKLLEQQYDLVIQAGIAGSFSKKIKTGETVIVERDAFADIGAEGKKKFTPVFDMGFGDKNEFPFKEGWLVNENELIQNLGLQKVKGITINTISGRKRHNKNLEKIFSPDVESMEGAAFHFVCLQQNVPFIQLRCISNKVGERNKKKWEIKKAVINLDAELTKIIASL
jgi:futalosine hydrolase